jgi:competence protein ComEC
MQLESEILIAPHHGSNSSLSYPLVKMADPQLVVFPTGYQNRCNHPADSIQKCYIDADAVLFDTADSGMISFYLNP